MCWFLQYGLSITSQTIATSCVIPGLVSWVHATISSSDQNTVKWGSIGRELNFQICLIWRRIFFLICYYSHSSKEIIIPFTTFTLEPFSNFVWDFYTFFRFSMQHIINKYYTHSQKFRGFLKAKMLYLKLRIPFPTCKLSEILLSFLNIIYYRQFHDVVFWAGKVCLPKTLVLRKVLKKIHALILLTILDRI